MMAILQMKDMMRIKMLGIYSRYDVVEVVVVSVLLLGSGVALKTASDRDSRTSVSLPNELLRSEMMPCAYGPGPNRLITLSIHCR